MHYRLAFIALPLLAGACVSPKAPPPPLPPPPPVMVPIAPPKTTDWRDIPLTPGDWRYSPAPGGSAATFGQRGAPPVFVARCDIARRTVSLLRVGAAAAGTMVITTSAGTRALAAVPVAAPEQGVAATLPARDGTLDRMAFSRGRFGVALVGTARLVIPAWPEFARVVEDCRG